MNEDHVASRERFVQRYFLKPQILEDVPTKPQFIGFEAKRCLLVKKVEQSFTKEKQR